MSNFLENLYTQSQSTTNYFTTKFSKNIATVLARVKVLAIANLKGIQVSDVLEYELVWREALRQAGYYTLVNDLIDKQFNTIYKGTLNAFNAGGLKTAFTTADASKIQIIKQMKRDFFIRIADDIGLDLKRELYKYAISDASLATMTTGISQRLASTKLGSYAETYARTSIQEFQQEVIDLRASKIEEGVWVYVGVSDDATRDFCNAVLNDNYYYDDSKKSEIESNPLRQYNCRHRFYFISEATAIDEGYIKY